MLACVVSVVEKERERGRCWLWDCSRTSNSRATNTHASMHNVALIIYGLIISAERLDTRIMEPFATCSFSEHSDVHSVTDSILSQSVFKFGCQGTVFKLKFDLIRAQLNYPSFE